MKRTYLTLPIVVLAGFVAWRTAGRGGPKPAVVRPAVAVAARPAPERSAPPLGRVVRDGVAVECRVTVPGSGAGLVEGQDARFEFTIADGAGKSTPSKVYPSAWVVSHPDDMPAFDEREAVKRAETLINGSLFNPPELDLNVYYVATLNHNATITVVDPLFGFGGTKLLTLVPLAARGDDWALGPGGRSLFVAMPEANKVAVIDTGGWKVTAEVPGGVRPGRLAVQPDGRYVWVAGGAEGSDDSGVTVLDAGDNRIAARIRTGRGRHDLAFSDDSRWAFVTNAGSGTVTVVDTATLRDTASVRTGRRPTSIAYSSRAKLAYVTDVDDGTVSSVDPEAGRVMNTITVGPGLGPIRFGPSGGVGFVLDSEHNRLHIIDPTSNRVVQEAKTEDGPNQLAFSDEFLYVRHRGSSNIMMVSLKTAGREGAPLSTVSFTAGQAPAGAAIDPTPADSIVPAPGASAVLVANPGDRAVYYYKEGLSAPMGTFNNYNRAPRAVLALDRSLREREHKGVFETIARLPRPGRFDVIFVLDRPRIVHAFPFEVRPDPAREASRNVGKVDVEPLVASSRSTPGQTFRPLFQLNDRTSRFPRTGLADVEILVFRVGGGWQARRAAREVVAGVYGADFAPEEPGLYHVCVACASTGLGFDDAAKVTLLVSNTTTVPTPPVETPQAPSASPSP